MYENAVRMNMTPANGSRNRNISKSRTMYES